MSDLSPACLICGGEPEFGYLSASCFTRLASMLRQIEEEAAILEAVPSMQQRTGSGSGSLASHRSPAILDAIVARDPRRGSGPVADPWGIDDTASVLETLHSWARMVQDEAGFPAAATVTVSGERDYLTRHLHWIARQLWVDEMFREMRELLGQLQRTNKTQPDRPEGICFRPAHESTCGGWIWRRVQPRIVDSTIGKRKVEVADGAAYCDRCHATWDGPELNRLSLILEAEAAERARPKTEDGRRMLTAHELVEQGYVKTVSNVRVKAHRLGVSSVDGHYDPAAFGERMTA